MTETVPMFEELPVYPEDLERIKQKKPKVNALQDVVIDLMNARGLKDADIIKATGIPWATWDGWITGKVGTQLADENLKKLMQFFNVHLEFLVYGIGNGEPAFEKFEDKSGINN